MKTFPLRVLAPERTFFDGACTSLTVPSIDGIYGLMAQHEDIVLAVVPGKLTLRDADGVEQIAAVSEGVLKMEHGEALVLVDTIERPEEIDLHRAEEMAAEARAELNGVTLESLVVAVRVAKAIRICAEKGTLDPDDFPLLWHVDEIISRKMPVDIPWEKFTFER